MLQNFHYNLKKGRGGGDSLATKLTLGPSTNHISVCCRTSIIVYKLNIKTFNS